MILYCVSCFKMSLRWFQNVLWTLEESAQRVNGEETEMRWWVPRLISEKLWNREKSRDVSGKGVVERDVVCCKTFKNGRFHPVCVWYFSEAYKLECEGCCVLTWKSLYNRDGLGRIQCHCHQALTYQNGDYMGSLNKKASGAQCFIMALGLFWDIVTGLSWTPNGVGSVSRGYCIFLPGAHYLTINSQYGADSSFNKLLLLLLKIFVVISTVEVITCSDICWFIVLLLIWNWC